VVEAIFGSSMEAPGDWWQGPARLLLAVLLGGFAGFEREVKGRAAGVRTYMMVSLGSAGFALIGMEMLDYLLQHSPQSAGHATRIISAVVGGVGFLGAGAIIQAGGQVRGLTTAAGMWVIAAVGASAGAGLIGISVTIAVLTLLVLVAAKIDDAARGLGEGS
jgi:putative Mg2+ transporter-C (MgtC) family protein